MEAGMRTASVDGVLLLDKPSGPGSNAVLQHAKRLMGAERAGHTGTLDPLASGLLVITFGEATRFSGELLDADKSYRARVRLGIRTSTGDAEGEVLERSERTVQREEVATALERFAGEIEQLPPMHSALKHRGRPLYDYARKGQTVERRPRKVRIRELELVSFAGGEFELRVLCSKGTYIRTLAEDIGEALGCGAHLAALRRTAIGPFSLDDAIGLDALGSSSQVGRLARVLPPEALLGLRPRLALSAPLTVKFRQGQAVALGSPGGRVSVFGDDGGFLGSGEVDAAGVLRPRRLMASSR